MFGDVGGLNDFIAILLAFIFGFFSDKLHLKAYVVNLYHYSSKGAKSPAATLNNIQPLKVSACLAIFKSLFHMLGQ